MRRSRVRPSHRSRDSLHSKDASRSEAIRRWPAQASLFARVKDDGRAEAALIAVGGIVRAGGLR